MSAVFQKLKHFISDKMQTSHIYQPAMLMKLLQSSGEASVQEIAKHLLSYDDSQVEYYEERVKVMVGEVLTKNHGITEKVKDGRIVSGYKLLDFNDLTEEEISELIHLCNERLNGELDRNRFKHRNARRSPVSGSIRFKILQRAMHRCELCGISAHEKALDIDHIVPKNRGGSDDESNLQALCYTCNRSKGDRDKTDFRDIESIYSERDEICPFCTDVANRVIEQNELALAFLDGYPVTEGHTLIIPKRHVADYFDLLQPELNAIHQLIASRQSQLREVDSTISGFNVGVNAGISAGQTVFHCHIHLIPRRNGDMDDPKGGVRGVIPEMQKYR